MTLFMSCFFFNDTATTEIYTLSLHDALPISQQTTVTTYCVDIDPHAPCIYEWLSKPFGRTACRSEEHTSELQSRQYLVCRLLLEKKKQKSHSLHQIKPISRMHSSSIY